MRNVGETTDGCRALVVGLLFNRKWKQGDADRLLISTIC